MNRYIRSFLSGIISTSICMAFGYELKDWESWCIFIIIFLLIYNIKNKK